LETIILASASPRRREYFTTLKIPFIIQPSLREETYDPSLMVEKIPETVAKQKVLWVAENAARTADWIFGADTLVALGNEIFGKPKDRADARRMLSAVQDKTHRVISGIALFRRKDAFLACKTAITEVTFAPISPDEIEWYLDQGEWTDAAGAYKAQGIANCFISRIHGSFSNAAGLPLREFYTLLRENGYCYGG
jgi:septum formation protein